MAVSRDIRKVLNGHRGEVPPKYVKEIAVTTDRNRQIEIAELSPNLGDGLRDQAAAVWDCEDAGLAATSIPSVNLTP
jgi:hypothetical protein